MWLDLTGMPPSVNELREFLADKAVDKRSRIIDRLLESSLFARHWAATLDVMLMERRPSVNVSADEWQNYLLRAAAGGSAAQRGAWRTFEGKRCRSRTLCSGAVFP